MTHICYPKVEMMSHDDGISWYVDNEKIISVSQVNGLWEIHKYYNKDAIFKSNLIHL